MIKTVTFFITLVCMSFVVSSCGGSKQMVKSDVEIASESPCPEWFTTLPEDPDYIFGAATFTSRDLQMAINKAKQQGRADIGSQIEIKLKALNKQFQEEVGVGEESEFASQATVVIKEVISQTLRGSKAKYQTTNREGVIWRACVLMEYPIGEANAQFVEALNKRDILRQGLAASQAYEELDAEVEKFEQEKKTAAKNQ